MVESKENTRHITLTIPYVIKIYFILSLELIAGWRYQRSYIQTLCRIFQSHSPLSALIRPKRFYYLWSSYQRSSEVNGLTNVGRSGKMLGAGAPRAEGWCGRGRPMGLLAAPKV